MRTVLRRTSIAAAFVVAALAAGSAQAGVATPAAGQLAGSVPLAENVHWVCGPFRCVWRPNYPAWWYVPPYARRWAPPPRPACDWRFTSRGWVQFCP